MHNTAKVTLKAKTFLAASLSLYRLYYRIGDYDSAMEVFSSVADPQHIPLYESQDY